MGEKYEKCFFPFLNRHHWCNATKIAKVNRIYFPPPVIWLQISFWPPLQNSWLLSKYSSMTLNILPIYVFPQKIKFLKFGWFHTEWLGCEFVIATRWEIPNPKIPTKLPKWLYMWRPMGCIWMHEFISLPSVRCGERLAGMWSLSPWVCTARCTCMKDSPGPPRPRKERWRNSLWITPPRNFNWSSASPAQTAATKCSSESIWHQSSVRDEVVVHI